MTSCFRVCCYDRLHTVKDSVCRLIFFFGKDHLFKRSIMLIKNWCYYESYILGAQHMV
jgi:hypothetical protein